MAVTVRITETYDLKTTLNKIGIIGIHTPNATEVNVMYPGLVKNHKFMRLLRCDVVGVCASALPPDPYQISSGAISPEDMFNPILYKAVTNESFETLQNRILAKGIELGAFGSVNTDNNVSSTASKNFDIYYSLLATKDGFRKCMPQNGFKMVGLRPLCHTLLSTFGNMDGKIANKVIAGSNDGGIIVEDHDTMDLNVFDSGSIMGTGSTGSELMVGEETNKAVTFRGKAVPYPKIPLHTGPESIVDLGIASTGYANFSIPKTMCGMIIIPPARQTIFSYRVRVSWKIRFENLISSNVMANYESGYAVTGPMSHRMNWTPSAKEVDSSMELDNKSDSLDTSDVDINKIMVS